MTNEDPLDANRSNTKQQKLNQQMNEAACQYIAGDLLRLLEEALGDQCKVAVDPAEKDLGHIVRVEYPETSTSGNLLPYIQLEIGPLASWLPHGEHIVRPYAAEQFPDQFDDPTCRLRAIDAERTFWEKATILHHEANRPDHSPIPERYSRHYYDLFLMTQDADLKSRALKDLPLLESVIEFKKRYYPRGWADYDRAMPGSFRLIPPKRVLEAMGKDYDSMEEMIFGRRPSFNEIIRGLTLLEEEINAL